MLRDVPRGKRVSESRLSQGLPHRHGEEKTGEQAILRIEKHPKKERESQEGGGDLTLSGGGKMFFPTSTVTYESRNWKRSPQRSSNFSFLCSSLHFRCIPDRLRLVLGFFCFLTVFRASRRSIAWVPWAGFHSSGTSFPLGFCRLPGGKGKTEDEAHFHRDHGHEKENR